MGGGTKDDGDLSFLRRGRRRRGKSVRLAAALVAAGLAATVTGLLLVRAAGRYAPLEAVQGSDWTHVEMVDHLSRRGVPCVRQGGAVFQGVAVSYYVRPGSGADRFGVEQGVGEDYATVWMCRDAAEARDRASVGESLFAWGRFVFGGGPGLTQDIRRALGK